MVESEEGEEVLMDKNLVTKCLKVPSPGSAPAPLIGHGLHLVGEGQRGRAQH